MAATSPAPGTEQFGRLFRQFEGALNGGAGAPVHSIRLAALEQLRTEGFPTRQDEAWRHTHQATLTQPAFIRPAAAPVDAAEVLSWTAGHLDTGVRLVFVNGHFEPRWSRLGPLPEGVRVRRLAAAIDDGDPAVEAHLGSSDCHLDGGFGALNTAFIDDGALIVVDEGRSLDPVVEVIYATHAGGEAALVTPRTLVTVGAGGHLRFIETFVSLGAGTHLTAPVTEIIAGAGAQIEHVRIQRDAGAGGHAATLHLRAARDSRFTSHSICLGGRLVRNDVTTLLAGEGIDSTLNGLFLARGAEHVDNYTSIEHAAPHCSSHELYKGVLTDHAHGVFRGKIHVHQVAQQTDAYQSNQNLLLSDDAEIVSKPQLEIYADDVKCSHGSTTGELDDDAMFYLRTRGIPLATARRVLTRAFVGEVVGRIGDDTVREHVAGLVNRRLDQLLHSEVQP